jgi:DNA polymerase III alpha subunit
MHNTIFQTAKDLGQNAIALTDIYGLYGAVDFYNKAKSFDMKPLIGVELPYTSHLSTLTIAK